MPVHNHFDFFCNLFSLKNCFYFTTFSIIYSTGKHFSFLVTAGESQQYPAASQAGPQAYFRKRRTEGFSQVHSASAVGFSDSDEHDGHFPLLSQQEPRASQAGPQAYLRLSLVEYEQTQSLFSLMPLEQKLHSSSGGSVGNGAFIFASATVKTAKVKKTREIIFIMNLKSIVQDKGWKETAISNDPTGGLKRV